MRLDSTPYLAKPLVSPLLEQEEIHKVAPGAAPEDCDSRTSSSNDSRDDTICHHHEDDSAARVDDSQLESTLSSEGEKPTKVPDQENLCCSKDDVVDSENNNILLGLAPALRLEQLELKLKQQSLNTGDVVEKDTLYNSSIHSNKPLGDVNLKTENSLDPAEELKELETKLRLDLQNAYITPLVRKQKNKHELRFNLNGTNRYGYQQQRTPPFPIPFPEFESRRSTNHIVEANGNKEHYPESAMGLSESSSLPRDSNICTGFTEGNDTSFPCCNDAKSKYDRKNLYLLLNDVSECARNKRLNYNSERQNVYWSSREDFISKERRYAPQNLWGIGEEHAGHAKYPYDRATNTLTPNTPPSNVRLGGSTSHENCLGYCLPPTPDTPSDSSDFSGSGGNSVPIILGPFSSPSTPGIFCRGGSQSPTASECSPVTTSSSGGGGIRDLHKHQYVKRRQKNGYTPEVLDCSCAHCVSVELEAVEACKWLRAAGFPQYAQMYEEMQFPIDLACAEMDHSFLEAESLQALYRRLRVLNRCARIRLHHQTNNNVDESEDEEQQCALSDNWKFQRHSRRWSRVNTDSLEGGKLLDAAEPQHFKRSGSERIKDGAKAILKRMESMKTKKKKKHSRENLEISDPVVVPSSTLDARVSDLACLDLRLVPGTNTTPPTAATTPTGGNLNYQHRKTAAPRHRSLSRHKTSAGEDSSSHASDQSQNSTPLFRSRRRRKFFSSKEDPRSGASSGGGGSSNRSSGSRGSETGVFSDSECSPSVVRHCLMETSSTDFRHQSKHMAREKRSPDEVNFDRCKRPALKHSSSLTYTPELLAATNTKENFLLQLRNKVDESGSSLPSPDDERHSVYDNVPLIICNKTYNDFSDSQQQHQDLHMDSASTSAPEGSGSSECCTAESIHRSSPCPSQLDPDCPSPILIVPNSHSTSSHLGLQHQPHRYTPSLRKSVTVDRWHSFQYRRDSDGSTLPGSTNTTSSTCPTTVAAPRTEGMSLHEFSVVQMMLVKKRALLRLTALMEHHCPANKTSWNWELPKFMKRFRPPEQKDLQVFGIGINVTQKRTGYPLPPVIIQALNYLQTSCVDQVGLFRKPGVKSRIQKLRELLDSGETVDYSLYGAYDVADVVKTYFRDLPEVLLTNKISEILLTIFQFVPEEDRLEAVQCAMLLLPDENREACMTLLTFLAEIAKNSNLNQMTANNLAVCFAPSLFHLTLGLSGVSPLRRKNTSGTPEQKDLHDNKAAQDCLKVLIEQVTQMDFISAERLNKIPFTDQDSCQPVSLEELGLSVCPSTPSSFVDGNRSPQQQQSTDWAAYMDENIASLFKEVKEKSRVYATYPFPDPEVEVIYRKVGDGHPLRLWRVTTEVEAPPAELLNRVLRERHIWDDSIYKWRVVAKLDHQSEVFQFLTKSMLPKPMNDFCVLRCWRSDVGRVGGPCVLVETSVEHSAAPVVSGTMRGIVLASRYLIQPCGSGKSRITHISRVDFRGRAPEWYNKIYGTLAATNIVRVRDSFKHFAEGPESKV